MNITVEGNTLPVSEEVVKKWQFLSDYQSEMGNDVQWSYTSATELEQWMRLNEEMALHPTLPGELVVVDSLDQQGDTSTQTLLTFPITRDALSGIYKHPQFSSTTTIPLPIDTQYKDRLTVVHDRRFTSTSTTEGLLCTPTISLLQSDTNARYSCPFPKLSSLKKIIEFMSPVDDSYLLYTDIDEGLTLSERIRYYQELGTYCCKSYVAVAPISTNVLGSTINSISRLIGLVLNGQMRDYWMKELPESKRVIETWPMVEVASIIRLSPITTFVGILRSIYSRSLASSSADTLLNDFSLDSLAAKNWSDMKHFLEEDKYKKLSASLRELSQLNKTVNDEDGLKLFSSYIDRVVSLIAYVRIAIQHDVFFHLLTGVPIQYNLNEDNGRESSIRPQLRTPGALIPAILPDASNASTFISLIARQAKTCSNKSLAGVARRLLGLGLIMYPNERRLFRDQDLMSYQSLYPFYYQIYFDIERMHDLLGSSSKKKCQMLLRRYGREYLVTATEVLVRLTEHTSALPTVEAEAVLYYTNGRKIVPPHQDKKVTDFIAAALDLV